MTQWLLMIIVALWWCLRCWYSLITPIRFKRWRSRLMKGPTGCVKRWTSAWLDRCWICRWISRSHVAARIHWRGVAARIHCRGVATRIHWRGHRCSNWGIRARLGRIRARRSHSSQWRLWICRSIVDIGVRRWQWRICLWKRPTTVNIRLRVRCTTIVGPTTCSWVRRS